VDVVNVHNFSARGFKAANRASCFISERLVVLLTLM